MWTLTPDHLGRLPSHVSSFTAGHPLTCKSAAHSCFPSSLNSDKKGLLIIPGSSMCCVYSKIKCTQPFCPLMNNSLNEPECTEEPNCQYPVCRANKPFAYKTPSWTHLPKLPAGPHGHAGHQHANYLETCVWEWPRPLSPNPYTRDPQPNGGVLGL